MDEPWNAEVRRESCEQLPDIDILRMELIRLSEEGEISQSVKHIKKASDKVVMKIYSEYERRQMDNTCTQLTDTLITKF